MIEVHAFDGADQRVLPINDKDSGLKGYIVVDSTVLGPGMGGCRFWHYSEDGAALHDAQRLARGMSYKNAMADLPFGGGKTVLCKPTGTFDREAFFHALGRAVNEFGGDYVTAEDVGTTEADMRTARSVTPHVFGLPAEQGRAGGNPSPWTALGVFKAIEAVCERFDKRLNTMTVAVQGVGSVGGSLCDYLLEAGARLVVSDINPAAVERFAGKASVQIIDNAVIHRAECDVFSPCALGAVINPRVIDELQCSWIAGAANNQLATLQDGDALAKRGILYVPDYVANAGGVINVAAESLGYDDDWVSERVDAIGERVNRVLDQADELGIAPARAADELARALITRGASMPVGA